MIVMVAGSEDMRRGPVPIALAYAGFEARETFTTDEAERTVARHGAKSCVLVLDGESLDGRAGSASWKGFLDSHRAVPAVVVTLGEAPPQIRAQVRAAHRILLESPFDASAVVVAVRQASSKRRPAVRRTSQPLRDAG